MNSFNNEYTKYLTINLGDVSGSLLLSDVFGWFVGNDGFCQSLRS